MRQAKWDCQSVVDSICIQFGTATTTSEQLEATAKTAYKILIDKGILHEPDITKPSDGGIFFPYQISDNQSHATICHYRTIRVMVDVSDIGEYKPSVTISVRENEWLKVGSRL